MGDAGDKDTKDTVVTGGWWAPGSSSKSCLAASSHCSTSCLPPFRTGSVPLCLAGTAAPWCKGAPPGIAARCPMAGSRDRLSPAALSPQHLCFMGSFTAKPQVSALYLFICVLVHRKGRWVWTPEAPKRGKGTPRGTRLPKGWVGEESAAPSLQLLCSVLLSASPGWGRAAISGEDSSTAAPRPQNAAEFWIPAV